MKIPRHEPPVGRAAYHQTVDYGYLWVDPEHPTPDSGSFSSLVSAARRLSEAHSWLDDLDGMWASLEVMARAAACVAQLETGAGEVTLRWLGDLELVATAAAAGNLTVGLWMDGWHAAWITRDHLALEALARVPPSTVTGPVAHPFAEPLIGALQAFHRGDDAAPELALEALKKTDPAGIVDGVDEILATTVPFLDAFYRVMAMDEPTFQAKLIHAVEQWRTWYQGGNRGAYSRALAGLCARVHDGGWSIGVDSAYVPLGIVRGAPSRGRRDR